VPMFAAYHLHGVSSYSQARRPRCNPMVVVPSDSEVTIPRRIVLRASVHKALAIVNFCCVLSHTRLAWCQGTVNHDFVVLWTKWLEAGSLIKHGGEILYLHVE